MKIDKLPYRLIASSVGLYLTAILLFVILAYYYRPEVPISKEVTLMETKADGTVVFESSTSFLEGEEVTFKYFDNGIPRYQKITTLFEQKDTKYTYLGRFSVPEPTDWTYPIKGFVHVSEPIKEPLLGFLLK